MVPTNLVIFFVSVSSVGRNPKCTLPEARGNAQLPTSEFAFSKTEQLDDAQQEGTEKTEANIMHRHNGSTSELCTRNYRTSSSNG